MSLSLNLNYSLGLKSDVKDNIGYFDDNIIVYTTGSNVVLYDAAKNTQKFINGGTPVTGGEVGSKEGEILEGITAMTTSPNKRWVAVAEKGTTQGIVSIYDLFTLRKKKVLSTTETSSKQYVSLAFSPDTRLLITQSGEPDWCLFVWNWEKQSKPLTFLKPSPPLSIAHVSFHPNDNAIICLSGSGVMKLYRLIDNNLKLLSGSASSSVVLNRKDQIQNCLCHCWLSEDRLVAGTDGGDLILFESTGEFKTILAQSPSDGYAINAIATWSRGFVCGGEGGVVMIYEKTDDKDYYKNIRTIKVSPKLYSIAPTASVGTVHSLAVSPSEDSIVISTETKQIFIAKNPFVSDEPDLEPATTSDQLKKQPIKKDPKIVEFVHVSHSFHSHQVTGLDTAIRKPWLVTCSTDKTIRLWNYQTNTLEQMKSYAEDIYSISFHPSGLHVLAGFSDKLRFLNVLMKDFSKVAEFDIRSCRECKFSNGGQYFAAVNGTIVHIYNTYTFENIGNLRGHNGKIKSLVWSPDDQYLVTAGLDGAVYHWQLKDFKRIGENVQKTCLYTSAVLTDDAKTILAVGSDRKIKEISDSEIVNNTLVDHNITQLALSRTGKLLYAGTERGAIRCYKFPFNGDYVECLAHAAPVTRIKVAQDDSTLFTAGEDGTVFMLEVRSKDIKPKKGLIDNSLYADLDQVTVLKADIEEKNDYIEKLKVKYDELSMHHEYQVKLKEMNHVEKMKEARENFSHQLDQWKLKYESLMQEKADLEVDYKEKMKNLTDANKKKIQDLETKYQRQIVEEVERYQQLLRSKEELQNQYQQNVAAMQQKHEKHIQELKDSFEARFKESQQKVDAGKKDMDEMSKEFEETRRQIEEDADREIEQLKHEYEDKLATERQNSLKLKADTNLMSKKFGTLQKEIDEYKEEIAALNESKKQMTHQIHLLEKDILAHKKEIKDREESLGDKEKRIFDLKKRNQELEKFKFVLDYTIKELKKQIEPLNTEIADLKEQRKEMDQELERYNKNSIALEMQIRDLKLKNDALVKEIQLQKKRAVKAESECRRIRTDLHDTMQLIQEPNQLKERVKDLYKKHVDVHVQEVGLDTDIQKEYNRQREYLEHSVASLKKQLAKESEKHRADNNKIMQENVALITEINALRRELKSLKQNQRDKELVFITRRKVSTSPAELQQNTRKVSALSAPSRAHTAEESKMVEMQREEIKRLRKKIAELEAGVSTSHRPVSSAKLAALDLDGSVNLH